MSKLDKIKEELNTLRLAISILSAFLIAPVVHWVQMYNIENFRCYVLACRIFYDFVYICRFFSCGKIKEKTRDIERDFDEDFSAKYCLLR